LDERAPADAFSVYYALHHDPARTILFLHYTPSQHADGFLVRAQTGLDLFRPVVSLRAQTETAARDLLKAGLIPQRPYYLVAPIRLAEVVHQALNLTDAETLCTYRLDPARFTPEINVLVVANPAPDGTPRYEISRDGVAQAVAGVNWQSPNFAEVYVHTQPAARGRGWGKSVVAALVNDLLQKGRQPVYVVNEQNTASINLAISLGFVDTGARELAGQAVRTES
jgi:ribosomal protein S18 acetylase RimI-like enzyme